MTEAQRAERLKQRQNGGNFTSNGVQASISQSAGNLVKVETGLENEKYIEIVSGVTEGQAILIALPSTSTSTTKRSGFTGMSGGINPNASAGRTGMPKN
jgi:HlyD family secretion protein